MCEIDDEVKKYKDSSSFKIKTVINVFKFLRFLNGSLFYFVFTLGIVLLTMFLIHNNVKSFFPTNNPNCYIPKPLHYLNEK